MAKELTDSNFEESTSTGVSFVDFSATWCGPCRQLSPIVDELANDFEGKAIVAKVDVDTCPETTTKFGIRSIPAIIIFKEGKEVERVIGIRPKNALADIINKHLN